MSEMVEPAPSSGSAAFAEPLAGQGYLDSDAHYQSLALGVVDELDRNIGLILLTGSPPPDTDLFARHLERECAPKRHVRTIHGGTVTSVVSLVVAAGPSAVLVIDPPTDIAGEILQQLSLGPSSDDQYRAAVVLLGPDSLARGRAPGSMDGTSAMPAWMRFRYLARHEVEPFIRFQVNEAHLDQSIFKAPLVSLIESYADGDPAVVNRLADEILTATQGMPPESFAEVVTDLRRQIGEIRGASGEASASPVPASASRSGEVRSTTPVPVVEKAAQPVQTTNDVRVSASSVAPAEIASEATGSSPAIAEDGTASISAPEPVVESHRFVAPEEGELGSLVDGAMQNQVTSNIVIGTDELHAAPPVSGGATEDHSGSPAPALMLPTNEPPAASLQSGPVARPEDRLSGTPPAQGAAEISRPDLAPGVSDDEHALSPVPPAATPDEAPFAWQASASVANVANEPAFEIAPKADAPEPAPADSNRLPQLVSLASPDEIREPNRERLRTVARRRKWIVPTGIAASIMVAFGAASVSSLDVGPVVSAWFARAENIVSDHGLALAPARDVSREAVLAGSSEQGRATHERADTTVFKTIKVGSLSESSGDRREPPTAAAEPNVAIHSQSNTSNQQEPPTAVAGPNAAAASQSKNVAAPAAEPNVAGRLLSTTNAAASPVADHPPSGRVEVSAPGPTPQTPAQELVTAVARVGSPTQDQVAVAARSEPQPVPTPPIAKVLPLPSPAAELFLQRGDQLMAQGDIVPARLFFERAAEGGASGAALRLAKSYDPVYLRRAGVRGIAGDTVKATHWYEKAIASGDIEAELALLQLRANTP